MSNNENTYIAKGTDPKDVPDRHFERSEKSNLFRRFYD
jgi:hypothetical protein